MTSKINMFDWKKPTVQMLGRWQPWHKGIKSFLKDVLQKLAKSLFKLEMLLGRPVVKDKTIIHLIGTKFVKI